MAEEFKVIINNPSERHEVEQRRKSYSTEERWGLCKIEDTENGKSVLYRKVTIRAYTESGERETSALFPAGISVGKIGKDGNPYVTRIDEAEKEKVAEKLRRFLRLEEDVPVNFA